LKVLVDNHHGQPNWGQTGFPVRGLHTTLFGFVGQLAKNGFECSSLESNLSTEGLQDSRGLVIPSPTGRFNELTCGWESHEKSLFSGAEIDALLRFLRSGGSLLAFAYRFGDPFTKTNLGSVFAPLGCILNDEATIARDLLGKDHPLYTTFETTTDNLGTAWASQRVNSLRWRPVTTFSILSGYPAHPVVFAPRHCVRLRWPGRQVVYGAAPICVAGRFGNGRFILLGGPHILESDGLGLLDTADNREFAANLINWLFLQRDSVNEGCEHSHRPPLESAPADGVANVDEAAGLWHAMSYATTNQEKERTFVRFVEFLLTQTTMLAIHTRNAWSLDKEAELDLVFACASTKPVWTRSHGVVPVECKNWAAPVDATEISRFSDKLGRTTSKIGFFAARAFTSKAWAAVGKARHQHELIIALLHDEDYGAYLEGRATATEVVESSIVRSMIV